MVADLGGLVAGCYSVDGDPPVGELGNMWIRPSKIGTGLGRVLWQDAMATHGRPGASGSCVLPTSHARSDAGHRCPVELTVAARGLRTRPLESCLALIDTGPRTDASISQGLVGRLIEVPVVGQLLWRLRTDGLLRKGMSTAFTPSFQIPQPLVDDARGVTYHALTAASRATHDYLQQRPLPDRLTALGKPLLVIFGEQDRRWRPSSAALYRAVAGARVELLPGVGHSPIFEDPPRTAALLITFSSSVLSGQKRRGGACLLCRVRWASQAAGRCRGGHVS